VILTTLAHTLNRGRWAEGLAERYLRERELRLLARNYRYRGGEIDLIMEHTGITVFVEVRYRQHEAYGSPAESVDRRKQQRLIKTANHFLQAEDSRRDCDCRFDVIGITGTVTAPSIEWIRDAFQA